MILREPLISKLREAGKMTWKKLDEILDASRADCSTFCHLAITQGYLDRHEAGKLVGGFIGRSYLGLSSTLFQPEIVNLLPGEMAIKLKAVPVYRFGSAVTVAMEHPQDLQAVSVLEKVIGCTIDPLFSFADEIESAIKIHYQSPDQVTRIADTVDLDSLVLLDENQIADLRPVVEISEALVLTALKERASDIHIEPKRRDCVVRFRVDGLLIPRFRLPEPLVRPLAARYKIMANLDIAESRKPQDGRFCVQTPAGNIDVRVSTLPLFHGEKVVMRLLGSLSKEVSLNIEKLSLSDEVLKTFKDLLQEPNGIIFVTGPTGCGKSTTLYAALNFIDSPDVNITTIEDPIEYEISTLNQSAVDVKAGRTFQMILRSILRQDPDVILLGEIRDLETARIAAQAALTGHLVLSSLHTNNSLQALSRLVEMGVESSVVAPSILGVVGQRLVRRLCPACRKPFDPDQEFMEQFFFWEGAAFFPQLYAAKGCPECQGSGFRGRVAIHEIFKVTQEVRDLILKGKTYAEIRAFAYAAGFTDMRYDGFRKAFQGLTTIEEVVKATSATS